MQKKKNKLSLVQIFSIVALLFSIATFIVISVIAVIPHRAVGYVIGDNTFRNVGFYATNSSGLMYTPTNLGIKIILSQSGIMCIALAISSLVITLLIFIVTLIRYRGKYSMLNASLLISLVPIVAISVCLLSSKPSGASNGTTYMANYGWMFSSNTTFLTMDHSILTQPDIIMTPSILGGVVFGITSLLMITTMALLIAHLVRYKKTHKSSH